LPGTDAVSLYQSLFADQLVSFCVTCCLVSLLVTRKNLLTAGLKSSASLIMGSAVVTYQMHGTSNTFNVSGFDQKLTGLFDQV
jgi:hypothetical protein